MKKGFETNLEITRKFAVITCLSSEALVDIWRIVLVFINFIAKCNSSDSELIRFIIGQFSAREYSRLLVVIMCCVTRNMVLRLRTNLGLVSNLRAVVTTFTGAVFYRPLSYYSCFW